MINMDDEKDTFPINEKEVMDYYEQKSLSVNPTLHYFLSQPFLDRLNQSVHMD